MATDTPIRLLEPVFVNAGITNALKTLTLAAISLALVFKWIDWTEEQIAAVLGVVAAVFVFLSSVSAAVTRQKVTPLSNPRADDGTPLIKRSA